ncbi:MULTISPECIES: hydrogenase 2 operon protein HybA [Geobacter]|uniref:hydrogenase 2 operon protein HybA n=1 Tax=Geobacter TaxID=28231 RepID=UPI0025738A5C|nr:hydrogenase 2 operon protein HybA [Geobacter sulfurreducens]BEH11212.1 hydrogenase 2 operon protein HybA [Geobacter sulfurreducens subsp. ethanolicus]BET59062.1 hydrogenase 2 operon protein HybA [Geobacter sp. 60473]
MKSTTRRDFLKMMGMTGAACLACAAPLSASTAPAGESETAIAMLYDATRCVGCKACMAACKRVNMEQNNLSYEYLPTDGDKLWDAPKDLSGDTRTVIKLYKESDTRFSYVKHSCMHCTKPGCVSACPVKAMTKDPVTGVVAYNKNACIGCRYCQVACPYNIPRFQWDKALPQIVKCDFCKDTNLKTKGLPACGETCPVGAIAFGKRTDLLAEAHKRIKENPDRYIPKVYGEKEVGGANHLYLAAFPFQKLGLPELKEESPAAFSEHIQHTIYKGFIAPVALYGTLAAIALRNKKKQEDLGHGEDD